MAVLALLTGGLAAQPVPCTYYSRPANPAYVIPYYNPVPDYMWSCMQCDSLLNHNGADYVDSANSPSVPVPYACDYTVVMVCRPLTGVETLLWSLDYGDSVLRAQTTEGILMHDGGGSSTAIMYAPQTGDEPVVATLRQTAPASLSTAATLAIGGGAPMVAAEVHYYGERLGDAALHRFQSRLAIRYGITLGPVDYVNSRGETIWDYTYDPVYHHRIAGVGTDYASNLVQLRSRSEMRGSMLTVAAGFMPDNTYLLTGDDDGPLTFHGEYDPYTGTVSNILDRRWRAQATWTDWQPFTLTFEKRLFPLGSDSLVLLLDGMAYRPDSITADSAVFSGIMFPHGNHYFTLGYGTRLWQDACCGRGGSKRAVRGGADSLRAATAMPTASVHPNPTSGRYTLAVSGADRVKVTVYDTRGAVVATFGGSGRERYAFEGKLPSGNIYYATIATEKGVQTIKLVVR